ncbi:MAG: hypothetical protein JO340_01185 [Acidobacteriaceae bacterium]|nr:hypothetical protein [Acidobacteriaceae bacterium]
MPRYRIHRIKEAPGENFRWAAHMGGLAVVKSKDYEGSGEDLEASSPYAAWKILAAEKRPLHPGDLLETVNEGESLQGNGGELQIAKYIGFEPAKWYVAEAAPNTGSNATEPGDAKVATAAPVHSA